MDKAKGLVAALAAMGLEESKVQELYGDVIEPIKASDPKDETGFPKAAAKVRLATYQSELGACAKKKDHNGAHAVVGKALKAASVARRFRRG